MMTHDLQESEHTWDCEKQSEMMLVHAVQSGNLDSFNALVLKYQDVMYRVALRILGQDTLAEDATQNAFISAYQHIISFRGGSLKAWFLRILVNKCYDEFRQMQRTAAISLNESLTDDFENDWLSARVQDRGPSIEMCFETTEQIEYLQECLNKLPTQFRVILTLVDVEELSYSEASTILKIPTGTVKSRLARARLYLRRVLMAGETSE
jgi:RNA polymerase sigma-70 factor (ECF subfamily)